MNWAYYIGDFYWSKLFNVRSINDLLPEKKICVLPVPLWP